jgi:hypothetical protein
MDGPNSFLELGDTPRVAAGIGSRDFAVKRIIENNFWEDNFI